MIFADFEPRDGNQRWWVNEDESQLATDLKNVYTELAQRDRARQDANIHHLRMYGNLPVEGAKPSSYNRVANRHRVTLNVVANVCDFVTSRIGKQRPMPKPLTTAGNYSLRRKAKQLDRFFQAQFQISRVYEATRRMFLDACVFGTGVLKVYARDKQIQVERIFPSEILVDPHEAVYGEPRQMLQIKWVSRDVLLEMFAGDDKKKRRIILDAGNDLKEELVNDPWREAGVNDQVLVLEAWHLPSGPDAKDGKHAIIVDSGPLLVEDWKYDYFPFVFFRWKDRLRGFWGQGLAEELNGIQIEINRMLMKIQTAFHLLSLPRIFIDAGSKIQKAHINNEIGAFVPFVGNPPIVSTPQTFHPEFFQHLERLYQKAFEIAGISQDAAAPNFSPEESGIARQYRHDMESERFSIVSQNFEQAILDLSVQFIDRAEDIAKTNGGRFATPSKRDKFSIEHIEWNEISMKEDEYILQVLPVSSLPTLPSARVDRVVMMTNAGLIDLAEAKRLIDFPDLDEHMALDRAASDAIDRIIEGILDDGRFEPPEPYMDLQLALKKFQLAYNRAKNDGVPEDRLEFLRRFMVQTHKLQQRAAIEQQKIAAMAAGGMAPTVGPAPGAPPATGTQGQPPTAVTPQGVA